MRHYRTTTAAGTSGILSNSFAFGGNNASILLGRVREPLFIPRRLSAPRRAHVTVEDVVSVSDDSAVCRVTVSPVAYWHRFSTRTAISLAGLPLIDGANRRRLVWLASPPAGQNSIELGMVLGARELLCAAGICPQARR